MVGQFWPKIDIEGTSSNNYVAFFLREKYTFRQKGSLCVFEPPSGGLGTTYAVHIRLRKLACDYLFIIKTIGVPGTIAKLWLIIGQICTRDRRRRCGLSPVNIRMNVTSWKTRVIVLPGIEDRTIVSSFLWSDKTPEHDGQIDRRTDLLCYYSALRCEQCWRAVKTE